MGSPSHRERAVAWLRRILTTPVHELSRWQRTVRFSIDLARHCTGELRHDKAGQMAAALTYHTLFSIIPTLVLALVALNMFASDTRRAEFKTTAVTWTLNVLQADPDRLPLDPDLIATKRAEYEAIRRRLDEQLQEFLGGLERVNFGSIGLVGVLLFIYGATGLLATVERSFNSILGVPSGRPWYVRLPLYYTVITFAPIVILIGQWAQGRFFTVIESGAWAHWLARPAAVAAPILALWLVVFLMFVLLPTGRVGKRAAAVASLVVAFLLTGSRELLSLYVTGAVLTSVYGALALFPLFLFFLWVLWVIVLFGLELTYTLDTLRSGDFKRERYKPRADELVDPAWIVPLSLEVAAAFDRGEAATLESLSRAVRLRPTTVDRLLEALVAAGIVHRVVAKDRPRYTLARPADAVLVTDILAAAHDAVHLPEGLAREAPGWRFVAQLKAGERDAAAPRTLADLRATDVR